MISPNPLLSVEGLCVSFTGRGGRVAVLRGIDFELAPRETLCIVGESGSGKSVTALALMGLLPQPSGRIDVGRILYKGEDLAQADPERLRRLRGAEIAMIFQEPMTSLNPVFTVGDQIAEALAWHEPVSRAEATRRAREMLEAVGIPAAERRLREYPHQLSGGMRQRVMIAMALMCRPAILVADEPTTALDVTVQAQILDLLRDLQQRFGMALVLITHSMGVVADMADRVIVMYAGTKVEEGPASQVLNAPMHPYTRALVDCTPALNVHGGEARRALSEIPGMMPALDRLPAGCVFAPRCAHAFDQCRREAPPQLELKSGHRGACWLAEERALA